MVGAHSNSNNQTGRHSYRRPLRCYAPTQDKLSGPARAGGFDETLDQTGSVSVRFSNLVQQFAPHGAGIPTIEFRTLVTSDRQIRHAFRVKQRILAINFLTRCTVLEMILELESFPT
jgi:hypothetical protein